MASSRVKVLCILYFFAVTSALNIAGYVTGFHRKPGEKSRPGEVTFFIETSLNLASDVVMLHTLYWPPRVLGVLLEVMWFFLTWNAGSTFICVVLRMLRCYHDCKKARVNLEAIPYNRNAATHRKILFMACSFQYALLFIFKFTLLRVVYTYYEELKAKLTTRNVDHRAEAGEAASQDFSHNAT
ncbi:hypothetical protein MTO96_051694 [Rhipicephalus appendiculatus]